MWDWLTRYFADDSTWTFLLGDSDGQTSRECALELIIPYHQSNNSQIHRWCVEWKKSLAMRPTVTPHRAQSISNRADRRTKAMFVLIINHLFYLFRKVKSGSARRKMWKCMPFLHLWSFFTSKFSIAEWRMRLCLFISFGSRQFDENRDNRYNNEWHFEKLCGRDWFPGRSDPSWRSTESFLICREFR